LLYVYIDREFGLLAMKSHALLSNILWNIGFYGHIMFGGVALFIGWFQFSKKLRHASLKRHLIIGKIYVMSVAISGTCGIYWLLCYRRSYYDLGFYKLGEY